MGHDHHHRANKNIKIAFFLNLVFTIFEIIGGLYVNSIAVISDAVHDLGDTLSLGASWYLQNLSNKKPDRKFSFGYRRFSLLAALINALVLILGSIYVISESIKRLANPEESDANGMILFAIIGIAVNGFAAWKVSSGKTMNEKAVSWHLMEDVLGWVAILIVAIVLKFYHNLYLDPALSLLITIYILYNSFKRLKETLFIFLQAEPADVSKKEVEQRIREIENVASVHHTHLWSLDGENHVFTTHVKLGAIKNLDELLDIKDKIREVLEQYKFEHYTIQTELDKEICGETSLHFSEEE